MKNFLFAIIFLGLTIYLGYELYERSLEEGAFDPSRTERAVGKSNTAAVSSLSYPVEMQIVRVDGSQLDILLTGRDADFVEFKRLSDGQAFTFEIEQLNASTQARVFEYPESGLSGNTAAINRAKQTTEEVYIEQLRAAIAKVNTRIEELEVAYKRANSKTEKRTLRNQTAELVEERDELEVKLAERNRP